MTSTTDIQLPSLPEPSGYYSNFYGEEDMKSYAIAAVEADRKNTMELLKATLWQPIETAPKDNKRPLYLARFSDGELIELDFNGSWEYWSESWELSHINGYCWFSEHGIEEPTHWAYQDEPLPTTQSSAIQNLLSAALEILKSSDGDDQNHQNHLDESGVLVGELSNAVKQIDD